MGVTLSESKNLSRKAFRWADQDNLTKPLSGWFLEIERLLEGL